MRTITLGLAAVAGLGCAIFSDPARANLITNPSFESGDFGGHDGRDVEFVYPGSSDITGWTVIGASGAYIDWIGPTNPFGLTASQGGYFLDLTGDNSWTPLAGVQQSFSTTPGAQYSLSFDLGSSSSFSGGQVSVAVSVGNQSNVTFTSTNNGSQTNLWQTETLDFTAAGDTTTLTIQGTLGYQYLGLDNVDVEGSSIPEPASMTVMIAAMTGLGLLRRRGAAR